MSWYKISQEIPEIPEEERSARDKQHGKSLKDSDYPYSIAHIFRAVPKGVDAFTRNDYITLSKKFAIGHAEHNAVYYGEDQQVISMLARSEHVVEASNPGEYFYIGPDKLGKVIYIAKAEEDSE